MRILVYGAGVLGGNLADSLFCQGKDVTLLARGAWYEDIKESGLTIRHYFGKKTNTRIPVINELKPDDCYDAIFVVVRYSQIESVLPVLKENCSPCIIFTGNNLAAENIVSALPEKQVLFAFALSAGHREKDHIESITLNRLTVGHLRGGVSGEDLVRKIFKGTKFKVAYEDNMGDWLLCHAAFVIPIAFACYYTDGDLRKVRKDKVYLNRVLDATIAAYRVLEDSGHEILPESDREYKNPEFRKKCLPLYRIICSTRLGKMCTSDHAMSAVEEMNALNNDLKKQLEKYGPVPDAWLNLEKETNGYLVRE